MAKKKSKVAKKVAAKKVVAKKDAAKPSPVEPDAVVDAAESRPAASKPAEKKKAVKKAAKKKSTKKQPMTLGDIYDQVSRKADTQGVKINVAETKRVMACFFDVLEDYKPVDAFDFIAKGLKRAGTRRR
ncbi:hypothetical protein [Stieleria varia]|uniref:Uncharacterized protein n=1 Tax=Stieleria varia TaxID=2528005 RepID=A0A5C6B8P1_9BACT|nr:hypothetical protein [Stieleria varia]TWU08338.1 hypothetical protein Pla52n_09200 [Stieleria varia]